jgi:hypothetical protein
VEDSLAGIPLLAKAEFLEGAGLSHFLDQQICRHAGVVEYARDWVGLIWSQDLESMGLAEAVKPVGYLEGVSILRVDCIFPWTRAVEYTRRVRRDLTSQGQFNWLPFLIVGVELGSNGQQPSSGLSVHFTYSFIVRPVIEILLDAAHLATKESERNIFSMW